MKKIYLILIIVFAIVGIYWLTQKDKIALAGANEGADSQGTIMKGLPWTPELAPSTGTIMKGLPWLPKRVLPKPSNGVGAFIRAEIEQGTGVIVPNISKKRAEPKPVPRILPFFQK